MQGVAVARRLLPALVRRGAPRQPDGQGVASAFRSGHGLNNKLIRALLADQDAFEVVSFGDERKAPAGFAQPARAW